MNKIEILVREVKSLIDQEIIDLNGITSRCFGKEVPLEETRKQFGEADFLSVVMLEEQVRGYGLNSKFSLNESVINYFGSGFIDPLLHDKELYARLNAFRINLISANAIMTRTQNPKVYSGFTRLCKDNNFLFSPDATSNIDQKCLSLAKEFCTHTGGAFSSTCNDEQICKNIYGRELMRNTPIPNERSNKVMSKLNISQGDAIILVGRKYSHL